MEPKIPQKGPYVLELKPGTYWWCARGRSKNQPFCDGSHKGNSGIESVNFELDQGVKWALCGCRHSTNKSRNDGTHKKFL
jgi:CDGSH-type Zn-finger protein